MCPSGALVCGQHGQGPLRMRCGMRASGGLLAAILTVLLCQCGRIEFEKLPPSDSNTDHPPKNDTADSAPTGSDSEADSDSQNQNTNTDADTNTNTDTNTDTDTNADTECREDLPETMSQFYPDCDGDGVFNNVPTSACDFTGANVKFNCRDGSPPDGGWSSTAGTDCDDEDPSEDEIHRPTR